MVTTETPRYDGRIEAFDAVLAYLNDIRGNGYDDPRDPALDAVYDKVRDLRSRAASARTVERQSALDVADLDTEWSRQRAQAAPPSEVEDMERDNERQAAYEAGRQDAQAAPPSGLDVERLQQAIDVNWPNSGVIAGEVAAEYERLSERTCVYCSGPDRAGPCFGGERCMARLSPAALPEPAETGGTGS